MNAPLGERLNGQYGSYVKGPQLAWAGQNLLFETTDPLLIYKPYKRPVRGQTARIAELAAIGRSIAATPKSGIPAHSINWPHDLIVQDDFVVGVVLEAAKKRFFNVDERLPGGRSPRMMTKLCDPKSKTPAGPDVRVFAVRSLANALGSLTRVGLVHGDLKTRNVLWSPKRHGEAFVVDCDGLYREGFKPSTTGTPGWRDPRLEAELIEHHDRQSDAYALALIAYRAMFLQPRGTPTRSTDYGAVPVELVSLFRQVFDEPTEAFRPTPTHWVEQISTIFAPDGVPDRDALNAIERIARPVNPMLIEAVRMRAETPAKPSRNAPAEDWFEPRKTPPQQRSPQEVPQPLRQRVSRPETSGNPGLLGTLLVGALILSACFAIFVVLRGVINSGSDLRSTLRDSVWLEPADYDECNPGQQLVGEASTAVCQVDALTLTTTAYPTLWHVNRRYRESRARAGNKATKDKGCFHGFTSVWRLPGEDEPSGRVISWTDASGTARVVWTQSASRLYSELTSSEHSLQEVCQVWQRLPQHR